MTSISRQREFLKMIDKLTPILSDSEMDSICVVCLKAVDRMEKEINEKEKEK